MEEGEEYSSKMPTVIIFMAHKGVHSLVFVCVIMWLGLQPLPTVEERARGNRGCPLNSPPPPHQPPRSSL